MNDAIRRQRHVGCIKHGDRPFLPSREERRTHDGALAGTVFLCSGIAGRNDTGLELAVDKALQNAAIMFKRLKFLPCRLAEILRQTFHRT